MANSNAPKGEGEEEEWTIKVSNNQHNVPRKAEEVEPDVDTNYSKMLFYAVETI